MEYFRRIMKESAPLLLLLVLGELIAGVILNNSVLSLENIPGLVILIPAILSLRGNVSSALGSRLGSYIHLGLIEPSLNISTFKKGVVKENIYASITLNITLSFVLGIFAYITSLIMGITSANVLILTFIAVVTGFLSGIFLVFLTIALAVFTASKGMDPDNVLTPTVATIGDVFTLLFLFFVAQLSLSIF